MNKFAYILFILIVIAALCVVLAAAIITDTAGAADECFHGCPILRPFKSFIANVSQCSGQYCGLFTIEPEPVR